MYIPRPAKRIPYALALPYPNYSFVLLPSSPFPECLAQRLQCPRSPKGVKSVGNCTVQTGHSSVAPSPTHPISSIAVGGHLPDRGRSSRLRRLLYKTLCRRQ